jgi:hypothetical protein
MKNEAVLHSNREERNSLCSIKQWKSNWTGHIFHKDCLPECVVIEGQMEVMGR